MNLNENFQFYLRIIIFFRVKIPERTELSSKQTEFHLVKSGVSDKNFVSTDNLVKSLGDQGYHAKINKKLQSAKNKSKVIPKPLEKPAAAKVDIHC